MVLEVSHRRVMENGTDGVNDIGERGAFHEHE